MATNISDSNRDLRAWLYKLLAELELHEISEARRTEINSTYIIIEIKFKLES